MTGQFVKEAKRLSLKSSRYQRVMFQMLLQHRSGV